MSEEVIRFGAGGVPYKPTVVPEKAPEPEPEPEPEPVVTVEETETEEIEIEE